VSQFRLGDAGQSISGQEARWYAVSSGVRGLSMVSNVRYLQFKDFICARACRLFYSSGRVIFYTDFQAIPRVPVSAILCYALSGLCAVAAAFSKENFQSHHVADHKESVATGVSMVHFFVRSDTGTPEFTSIDYSI